MLPVEKRGAVPFDFLAPMAFDEELWRELRYARSKQSQLVPGLAGPLSGQELRPEEERFEYWQLTKMIVEDQLE